MPRYRWEGRTPRGDFRKGELEAPNETAIRVYLRQQQIIPTKVVGKGKEVKIALFKKGRVKKKSLAIFTRQLATMIDAGLPLVQSLDILAQQEQNETFQGVIKGIKEHVEGGTTFAAALKKYPKVFDNLYINLVIAGEEAGTLDVVLNRLATHIEKMEVLKQKIKSALVYPAMITGVAVVVTIVLLVFVIPVFEKLFAGTGMSLPLPTQIVISVSRYSKAFMPFLILFLVILAFVMRNYYRTETGRLNIDKLVLKLPIFGELIRKVSIARFARTLATLVTSGVPILESLNIVAGASGNKVVEKAILEGRASISEGQTISEPLAQSGVFPIMVTQMISVGEATGSLELMLNKIADFFEEEVDTAVATLSSMLEPMLMIFLGVTIGGLVIAMYLPIFKMASAF
ncbi:MAG: type II secretion system F family protein [Deltaproteobacteria bacterium]|nr:MAG: type II secretion system F family protein [Deltaproteobacteria bacterium]